MHQPLFGAMFPLLIALCIYALRRTQTPLWLLLLTPPMMVFGAVWAVIPDLPRVFGGYARYQQLAADPRTNVFFWHYSIDRMEAAFLDRWTPLFNALFAVMLLALLAAAWHVLRREERQSYR